MASKSPQQEQQRALEVLVEIALIELLKLKNIDNKNKNGK